MAIEKLNAGVLGTPSLNRGVSGDVASADANPFVKKSVDQPGGKVADRVDKIKLSSRAGVELRTVSEEYAGHAQDVREADKVLEKAAEQLTKMKEPLDAIVKNFPPFDPDSKERVNYLNSFAGLRRQYELLTIPPIEPRWPPQFVFDNAKEGEAPVVGLGNGQRSEFPPGLVKTPELPLVPQLNAKSGDEQVAEASKQIGEAYEALVAARKKLHESFGEELSSRAISGVEAPVKSETEAVSLSSTVQSALANTPASIA